MGERQNRALKSEEKMTNQRFAAAFGIFWKRGRRKVTVHDPILSEVTFGARRFKTASKDGLGFKGRRRGHWA
jgi:hypothetical protein